MVTKESMSTVEACALVLERLHSVVPYLVAYSASFEPLNQVPVLVTQSLHSLTKG